MKYCKPHNKFYAGEACTACEDRVVAEATKMPLRVVEPQAHERCHQCFNLEPFCMCPGPGIFFFPDLPGLQTSH